MSPDAGQRFCSKEPAGASRNPSAEMKVAKIPVSVKIILVVSGTLDARDEGETFWFLPQKQGFSPWLHVFGERVIDAYSDWKTDRGPSGSR